MPTSFPSSPPPFVSALAASLIAVAGVGCVQPQSGSVLSRWCPQNANLKTLDDFEDDNTTLCANDGFPSATWSAAISGNVEAPGGGAPTVAVMTPPSADGGAGAGSDGAASTDDDAGVPDSSFYALAVSGTFTDPSTQIATGSIGVEAKFDSSISLTTFGALSYRIFVDAGALTGIKENVSFTCDGCATVDCGQTTVIPAGQWTVRTFDLSTGADCMSGSNMLSAVTALQIHINASDPGTNNSLFGGTQLTLAIDDVALIPTASAGQ